MLASHKELVAIAGEELGALDGDGGDRVHDCQPREGDSPQSGAHSLAFYWGGVVGEKWNPDVAVERMFLSDGCYLERATAIVTVGESSCLKGDVPTAQQLRISVCLCRL